MGDAGLEIPIKSESGHEPEQLELFPEVVTLRPCSANTCTAGHVWAPRIAVVACKECGAPVLAVKMEQCPVCNEPVRSIRISTHHVPSGGPNGPGVIIPMCKPGSKSHAEVTELTLIRNHANEIENSGILGEASDRGANLPNPLSRTNQQSSESILSGE